MFCGIEPRNPPLRIAYSARLAERRAGRSSALPSCSASGFSSSSPAYPPRSSGAGSRALLPRRSPRRPTRFRDRIPSSPQAATLPRSSRRKDWRSQGAREPLRRVRRHRTDASTTPTSSRWSRLLSPFGGCATPARPYRERRTASTVTVDDTCSGHSNARPRRKRLTMTVTNPRPRGTAAHPWRRRTSSTQFVRPGESKTRESDPNPAPTPCIACWRTTRARRVPREDFDRRMKVESTQRFHAVMGRFATASPW